MLGVTKRDVSRCVPLQGRGALVSGVAVTGGAEATDLGAAPMLPFTLPPTDLMDCHDPEWSPYTY